MTNVSILALSIELAQDDKGEVNYRAILWEIDNETGSAERGWASIMDIREADNPEDAAAYVLYGQDRPVAVKVPEDMPGAVPVGNHWVIWPEYLSTSEAAVSLLLGA